MLHGIGIPDTGGKINRSRLALNSIADQLLLIGLAAIANNQPFDLSNHTGDPEVSAMPRSPPFALANGSRLGACLRYSVICDDRTKAPILRVAFDVSAESPDLRILGADHFGEFRIEDIPLRIPQGYRFISALLRKVGHWHCASTHDTEKAPIVVGSLASAAAAA